MVKTITLSSICLLLCYITKAQEYDCGENILLISNPMCVDRSGSDYIQFNVELDGFSVYYNYTILENLPVGTLVTDVNPNQPSSVTSFQINPPDVWTVWVPSSNCDPVSFTADIYGNTDCEDVSVTVRPANSIPTMGQWGVIMLGLLILSVGIVYIRTTTEQTTLYNTTEV